MSDKTSVAPRTIEDFEKLSGRQLRDKVNESLSNAVASGPHNWPPEYELARFYLAEIDRRADVHKSRIDLLLELAIIILIAVEIGLGIREGNAQTQALSKVQNSLEATASTLMNQQHIMEAMNQAAQQQLAFASAVRLDVSYDRSTYFQITVTNSSAGEIAFWGARFGNQPRAINREPAWFGPGAKFALPATWLWNQFVADKPGSPERMIPFEIYCRNPKGLPYIVKGAFQGSVAANGEVTVRAQTTSTLQQEWR